MNRVSLKVQRQNKLHKSESMKRRLIPAEYLQNERAETRKGKPVQAEVCGLGDRPTRRLNPGYVPPSNNQVIIPKLLKNYLTHFENRYSASNWQGLTLKGVCNEGSVLGKMLIAIY